MPHVAVITCLYRSAVGLQFGIKSRVTGSRSRSRNRTRPSDRFGFGPLTTRRGGCGRILLFWQRVFARIEIGLALGERFLLLGLMFRRPTLLDLSLNLRVLFCFSLLLLAGK